VNPNGRVHLFIKKFLLSAIESHAQILVNNEVEEPIPICEVGRERHSLLQWKGFLVELTRFVLDVTSEPDKKKLSFTLLCQLLYLYSTILNNQIWVHWVVAFAKTYKGYSQ
jgi:hypothetical protein